MVYAIILCALYMFTVQGMETKPTTLENKLVNNHISTQYTLSDVLTDKTIAAVFEQHATQLIQTLPSNDINLTCKVHQRFSNEQTTCLLFALLNQAFIYQLESSVWKLNDITEIFNRVYGPYIRRQISLEDCLHSALQYIPVRNLFEAQLQAPYNWPGRILILAHLANKTTITQERLLLNLRQAAQVYGFTVEELKNQKNLLSYDVIQETLQNSDLVQIKITDAVDLLSMLLQDNETCLAHATKHQAAILASLPVNKEFVPLFAIIEKAQAIRTRHICSKFWRVASWTKEHMPTPKLPAFKLFPKK